jgi:alpha-amylase
MSARGRLLLLLVFLLCHAVAGGARSPTEWVGRRIYQVMTDRFSTTDNGNAPVCYPPNNIYCGGTYQGLMQQLDYIQNMGFNAIWISPIVENTHLGYHGYWAKNFFAVNEHFGSQQDLVNFVQACHQRDIWVMVDVVMNHAGPIGTDYSQIYPFNQSWHYHPQCQVTQYQCLSEMVLDCRLADLPDLDQDQPFVQQQLTASLQWALTTFGFDGIRADTVMYIKQSFWSGLVSAVGTPYLAGEVWADFSCNQIYAQYGVPATINYPLYYAVRSVYQQGGSMRQLGTAWRQQATLPHPNHQLNFVDNQDNDRFLQASGSIPNYQGALAYLYWTNGVPCVYYGTEQYFQGTVSDNTNRQAMWTSNFAITGMYRFLQRLNAAYNVFNPTQYDVEERWQDDTMYCLIRGVSMLCTSTSSSEQQRSIPNLPFGNQGTICELFTNGWCQNGQSTMTITVPANQGLMLFFTQGMVHRIISNISDGKKRP